MRNPFRIRASQRAVNDEQFVRLFAAGALELVGDTEDPWSGLVFLRSAPGGGKTTFLRLLTPGPLSIAAKLSQDSNVKATYEALSESGAMTKDGPALLAVMVAFTNEYQELEEMETVTGAFRALVNARVVLATLRAILERTGRVFPDDLGAVSATWVPVPGASIPGRATGEELYAWASRIEGAVYEALDELGSRTGLMQGGHAAFEALHWFATAAFSSETLSMEGKRVLLFDDVHVLSQKQRQSLRRSLTDARLACGVWVAERLEVLEENDLLVEGALEGRDYHEVIHLEGRWRQRAGRFKGFVDQVAELRARRADNFENRDFFAALAEDLDVGVWEDKFDRAAGVIEERVVVRCRENSRRYSEWFRQVRTCGGNSRERALAWRKMEILVERDIRRKQQSFDFEYLSEEELQDKADTAVAAAAELFLYRECQAPLYYGRRKLAMLASSNVDQFIELAGDLFEEIAAKAAGRREPTALTAERQDAILRKAAKRRWEGLPRRIVQGYQTRRWLQALGAFCRQQSYRPTAPYAPGVSGFGITMRERHQLMTARETGTPLFELKSMLSALVAQNLLEPKLDHRNKRNNYFVLYLNRLICARFELPLGYGGWREKTLRELVIWMKKGEAAVKEEGLV